MDPLTSVEDLEGTGETGWYQTRRGSSVSRKFCLRSSVGWRRVWDVTEGRVSLFRFPEGDWMFREGSREGVGEVGVGRGRE